jgi:DegV family protein with EDD domain
MLKIIVDSGSSIKQSEKNAYGVDIIPLKVLFGEKEYLDDVNLTKEEFYHHLIDLDEFPKTSLPTLTDTKKQIDEYVKQGYDVAIITISSKISGTYNALRMLFEDEKKVKVIDSALAVGGIRLIVEHLNRQSNLTIDNVEEIVKDFIPKIKIYAIPETLTYLLKGGRLSKTEFIIGSLLKVKPIIGFHDGKVKLLAKTHGLNKGMNYIAETLINDEVDTSYPIIASYTYDETNLNKLMDVTKEEYKKYITTFDDLTSVIAGHWGPNAFGYIFVSKK